MLAELLTPILHSNLRRNLLLQRQNAQGYTRSCTWTPRIPTHRLTVVTTHFHVYTHQGQASDNFRPSLVPKEDSILSSFCVLYLSEKNRLFLLCQQSKDFVKSPFLVVITMNKFQVIWLVCSISFIRLSECVCVCLFICLPSNFRGYVYLCAHKYLSLCIHLDVCVCVWDRKCVSLLLYQCVCACRCIIQIQCVALRILKLISCQPWPVATHRGTLYN